MSRLKENFIIFSFLFDDEYGKVFRAYNKEKNRKVWIKEIHDYILKDEELKDKILEKSARVKSLNHRNIQKLFDYWEEDGKLFFELENLTGTFLDEIVNNPKRLEVFDIISISYQLFTTLSYAHSRGIIHENVRPEHITVEKSGDIKITNFMMTDPMRVHFLRVKAKAVGNEEIEFYKFVRFTSPWHLRKENLDWRADFFSAAVIAFELTTKDTPWDRSCPVSFMISVREPRAVRHIWQIRKDISPRFSLIISKCLTDHNYWRKSFRDEIFETLEFEYENNVKPVLELKRKKRKANERRRKLITLIFSALLTVGLFIYPFQKQKLEDINSIPVSVPPLENKTKDKSLEPIVQGITQEIIEGLSNLSPLCVKPSSNLEESKSDFILKNEIVNGKGIEFESKLFKAKNGGMKTIFSKRFNLEDISSLRFNLSKEIMNALKLDFKGNGESLIVKKISPEVYNLYLNSIYWHNIFMKEPKKEYLDISRDFLLKAIDFERNFSPIYSALATNAVFRLEYGISTDPGLLVFAKSMCFKALEIDRNDTRARSLLSVLYMKENRKIEAYKELEKIYKMNPHNLMINGAIGSLYQYSGLLDKALEKYKKVKKENPIDSVTSINIARIYIYQGKFSKAEKELRKTLKKSENSFSLSYLGILLSYSGRFEEAERLLQKGIQKYPDEKGLLLSLATVYLREGKIDEADKILRKEEKYFLNDADKAYRVATCYALKDDKESALKWLRTSINLGNENYILFKNDPYLENIKEDKDFKELMKEIERRWKRYKKEFTL